MSTFNPFIKTFSPESGKTLFMTAASRAAVLVTRSGKRMRRRSLAFADAHAALDWCLDRRAVFVLVPSAPNVRAN